MQKTIVQSTVAEILGCIALAWMQSGDIRPAETHRVLGKQIVGAIQLDQPGKVTDLKVRDTTTLVCQQLIHWESSSEVLSV